jgi:hypothetical protein
MQWEEGELAALEAREIKDDRNAGFRKLGLCASGTLILWGTLQILALEPLMPGTGFVRGLSTIALGISGALASLAAFPSSSREERMLDDLGLDSLDPMS